MDGVEELQPTVEEGPPAMDVPMPDNPVGEGNSLTGVVHVDVSAAQELPSLSVGVARSDTTDELPAPNLPSLPSVSEAPTSQPSTIPSLSFSAALPVGAPPISLLDTHSPIRPHASRLSSTKPSSHSEEESKGGRRRRRDHTGAAAGSMIGGRGKRKRKKRTFESEEEVEVEKREEEGESVVKCLCGVEERRLGAWCSPVLFFRHNFTYYVCVLSPSCEETKVNHIM
ncbi:hypothetical protein BT69DRAFT_407347 [Atractiella rhizophila]|nr:hypothetical protein BT69DRAFT_407347 [Atractiella rhizophila]